MSTLWFEVMSRFEDNPDWSKKSFDSSDELQDMYERRLGIGQKSKARSKHQADDYSWLKPPEDWKKPEAIDGI